MKWARGCVYTVEYEPSRFMESRNPSFKTRIVPLLFLSAVQLYTATTCKAQPDPNFLDHDRTRAQPPVVTPATPSTQEQPGKPPSDAIVLFDGKDLSQWVSMDGSPTKWIGRDGYMECV